MAEVQLTLKERLANLSKRALLGSLQEEKKDDNLGEIGGETGGETGGESIKSGNEIAGENDRDFDFGSEKTGGETTENDSGIGDSSIPAETEKIPGKRGRHKKECECEKCIARREKQETGETPSIDSKSPSRVDFKLLFPGLLEDGKKPKIEDSAAGFFMLVGKATGYLSGYPHICSLANEEARDLGRGFIACINTIPAAKKAQLMARAENVLPWAAFGLTTIAVVAPRVMLYQMEKSNAGVSKSIGGSNSKNVATNQSGNVSADGSTVPKSDSNIDREALPNRFRPRA